jgi:uncharacterized membrane protein
MTVFAFAISLYALSFFPRGEAAFPPQLRASFNVRILGIYSHVLFGGIALALGPFQFRRGLLLRSRPLHRRLGLAYVIASALTGVSGMYMALYSHGGLVTHLGFGILGFLTLMTALKPYFHIRAREVAPHREWMIRNYALLFAAVTLRIELPLLAISFQAFEPAYRIVSWFCWVPNLLVAEWYIRRSRPRVVADLPVHSRAATA